MAKEIQVLFIDDESDIIDSMKRLFMREAYGVAGVTRIEDARRVLSTEKIKVVVSDQRMPEMEGVQFLKEVKQQHPDSIRILFTGYTDITAAEEAINLGEVYRFLTKPWKSSELVSTIRQAIEHYDLVIESRKRKEELEIAHKRLKEMYEMQKEFTSTVSHELRTPLASIKTAIDLVIKRMVGDINAEQQDILERAKRNVDRLKRLIDDILDLMKIESGRLQMNFQSHDLVRVVQDAVEFHKPFAQSRGLALTLEPDPTVAPFVFDSDRITQVMNNLLNNAIKFTPQGGVTVKIENHIQGNHALVSIKDTGKGISEEDLPKLFRKFQQLESATENQEGGTGLGLAICKEIVTRHAGKIWAESRPGEGSTFSFLLPLEERRNS